MRDALAKLCLFLLLLVAYAWPAVPLGWNQNSRLDLLHALWRDGGVVIDRYHQNSGDTVEVGGHWYSDKAPGTAVIALPAFALAAGVLRVAGIPLDSDRGWWLSARIATVGSVALLAAAGGLIFFVLVRRLAGVRPALVSVLALFLGSLPFTYGAMLFAHAGTIGLLCIALAALLAGERGEGAGPASEVVAGACAGMALAGEYSAGIAAVALFVYVLLRGRAAAARFTLAGLPALALIPLYNWVAMGSPLRFGYWYQTNFQAMNSPLFGLHLLPDPGALFGLLFSEFRGLLFWTPFLLLALPGYVELWRARRRWFWLVLAVPVLQVLAISTFTYWHGGWALGPRFLAACLPFLGLAAAFGAARFPRTAVGLAALSVLLTGTATLVAPMPPDSVTAPLREIVLPAVLDGRFLHGLGTDLGLGAGAGVLLLLAIEGSLLAGTVALLRGGREPAPGSSP